jgi:hypothetical protein
VRDIRGKKKKERVVGSKGQMYVQVEGRLKTDEKTALSIRASVRPDQNGRKVTERFSSHCIRIVIRNQPATTREREFVVDGKGKKEVTTRRR